MAIRVSDVRIRPMVERRTLAVEGYVERCGEERQIRITTNRFHRGGIDLLLLREIIMVANRRILCWLTTHCRTLGLFTCETSRCAHFQNTCRCICVVDRRINSASLSALTHRRYHPHLRRRVFNSNVNGTVTISIFI